MIEQEHAAAAGWKPRFQRGLLQSPKPRNGALVVPIPRAENHVFQIRASIHRLANLGHGTKGFKDPDLIHERPKALSKVKELESLGKILASANTFTTAKHCKFWQEVGVCR